MGSDASVSVRLSIMATGQMDVAPAGPFDISGWAADRVLRCRATGSLGSLVNKTGGLAGPHQAATAQRQNTITDNINDTGG